MTHQVGYEAMMNDLRKETINLSDDGTIANRPAFKALAKEGVNAKVVLEAEFASRPTRAVMLLLRRLGEKF